MFYGTIEEVKGITIKNDEVVLEADGVEFILEPKGYTDVTDKATDVMESAFNALYEYYSDNNIKKEDIQELLNEKLEDMVSRIYQEGVMDWEKDMLGQELYEYLEQQQEECEDDYA